MSSGILASSGSVHHAIKRFFYYNGWYIYAIIIIIVECCWIVIGCYGWVSSQILFLKCPEKKSPKLLSLVILGTILKHPDDLLTCLDTLHQDSWSF